MAEEVKERVTSVTKFNSWIHGVIGSLNPKIETLWVEGEISGWKSWGNGFFFTVKDEGSQLSCSFFPAGGGYGIPRDLGSKISDGSIEGAKVRIQGSVALNIRRGQYQFSVSRMRLADTTGDLMKKFLELKEKLSREGLLANGDLSHEERRARLPFLPHRIGIVTSPDGAVIHDMCDVIFRRFPNVEVRLFPTKVQGPGAAEEIAAGVEYFNRPDSKWVADVLIVGRGGGSVEDLWAYNEEPVVRAVAASRIPVISAVGHEPDISLCDFAATVRAGTPSIAGEYVVPVKAELSERVADLSAALSRELRLAWESSAEVVDDLQSRTVNALKGVASSAELRLQRAEHSLAPALSRTVSSRELRLLHAHARLRPSLDMLAVKSAARLERAEGALTHLNPYQVLGRGYSLTVDSSGKVVRSSADVSSGDVLTTRLAEGTVTSVVS